MDTESFDRQLSPTDYAAFREAAKWGASQARREAIDQFWSALGRRWTMAWRAMQPTPLRVGHAGCGHGSDFANH